MRDWIAHYCDSLLEYFRFKVCGSIASVFFYTFGSLNDPVYVLLIFTLIDTILGFVKAVKERQLSSDKLRKGVVKFIIYFIFIVLANCLDKVFGSPFGTSLRSFSISYLIITEGISILENLQAFGLNIPEKFKKLLDLWKSK